MILKCLHQYCHKSSDFALRACCLQKFFTFSKTSALISIWEFFFNLSSIQFLKLLVSASLCSFSILTHFLFKILLVLCIIMCGNLHGSSSHNLISRFPSYMFPGTSPENEVAVPKDSHESGPFGRTGVHMSPL